MWEERLGGGAAEPIRGGVVPEGTARSLGERLEEEDHGGRERVPVDSMASKCTRLRFASASW